jgi:Flp pilus assembly pilin Flp
MHTLRRFANDETGSNAIEFAILAMPFMLLLISVVQIAIFFVAQAALDIGLLRTAEGLRVNFYTASVTSFPNASTLKTRVATYAGGLIVANTNLSVEIRPLTSLTSAVVPVVDATNDYGTTTSVLALRAWSKVPSFLPGVPSWVVTSSALVRRQGR